MGFGGGEGDSLEAKTLSFARFPYVASPSLLDMRRRLVSRFQLQLFGNVKITYTVNLKRGRL